MEQSEDGLRLVLRLFCEEETARGGGGLRGGEPAGGGEEVYGE